MSHLFAYGTLMCSDIMVWVSGRRLTGAPARLLGYRRWCVRAEAYPGVSRSPGGRVEGILYRNLSADAWRRLDRFEGDMYERVTLPVQRPGGGSVAAQVYVVRRPYRHLLELREWDFQDFLRRGKAGFVADYRGYDAVE